MKKRYLIRIIEVLLIMVIWTVNYGNITFRPPNNNAKNYTKTLPASNSTQSERRLRNLGYGLLIVSVSEIVQLIIDKRHHLYH